LRTPE
jgi:DNA gyrase/topoisomerase IV subunit A